MMSPVFLFASLSSHVSYFLPSYHCEHMIHLHKVADTKEENSSRDASAHTSRNSPPI